MEDTTKEKRIIEINGIKMEIDLRTAKKIDIFKVGDTVKILVKTYGDNYETHLGIIVGFDEFEKHPTIIVAYLKSSYDSATIQFAYINDAQKEYEICAINEWDVPYSKQSVIDKFNREITKKEEEIRELKSKINYFTEMFGKYFEGKVNGTE